MGLFTKITWKSVMLDGSVWNNYGHNNYIVICKTQYRGVLLEGVRFSEIKDNSYLCRGETFA